MAQLSNRPTPILAGFPAEITIRRDAVEVTSNGPRPDPGWLFVDGAGHQHQWSSTNEILSTEEVVVDTYWCVDCCDQHEEVELRCRICGEKIHPGTLPPNAFREFVPGPAEYAAAVSGDAGESFIEEYRGVRLRWLRIGMDVEPLAMKTHYVGVPVDG